MNILCDCDDPYSGPITQYIKREFPALVKPHDADILDLLTEAIVASGQVRFGPKPSPESLVSIRQVISAKLEKNSPIPFLIGWGSEKPDGSGVDIAELFALKTLSCLQDRVKSFYKPGVEINIRVEDASAPHLFFERPDVARAEAAIYTEGFRKLAQATSVAAFVHVVPESSLTSESEFNTTADKILPLMEKHVANPQNSQVKDQLLSYGWKTPLSDETKAFFLARYSRLYPDKTAEQQSHILARYFAGSLSRYVLGITGRSASWEGSYLELSFASPTPGIGAERALRRLYYRTMPSSITNQHMPAWRSKGYLKIGNEVTAGLTTFHSAEHAFNRNVITLSGNGVTQEVQADYVVQ